jgi:Tol biopolymer transport system component
MDSPRTGAKSISAADTAVSANGARLDSWKEIAAYLRRDVATVRRWEKREGLPVHRHQHDKLGSVYAIAAEIDEWSRSRSLSEARQPVTPVDRAHTPRPVTWTAAAPYLVIAVIAGACAVGLIWTRSHDTPEARFLLTTTEDLVVKSLAISPDGSQIALAGSAAGQRDSLWLRDLNSTTPRLLLKTEGGSHPFWAPDGRRIGFFAGGNLKRIDLANGSVETICKAGTGRGGTWNRDDVIVFSPKGSAPLMRVSARGGDVTRLTTVTEPDGAGHAWPEFLPDGRRVLYYAESTNSEREGVYVVGLDSGQPRRLLAVSSNAIPTSKGQLLFIRDHRLMAQAFDVVSLQLKGKAVAVAEPVLQQRALRGKGDFSVSAAGVLAYRVGSTSMSPLVWIDRNGTQLGSVGEPAYYGAPVLSPDGKRAAVVAWNLDTHALSMATWLIEVATGMATRLTLDPRPNFMPLWSPGGERVAFASRQGNVNNLVQKAVNGIASEDLMFEPHTQAMPEDWSSDGRFIFYSVYTEETGYDMWALPLFGDRKPFPVLRSEHWEAQAQLSPDRQLLSYTSDESGQLEVYVTDFPSRKGTRQISTGGGGDARWRRDGRELFYIAPDGRLMAVAIDPEPNFTHGVPHPLFQTRIRLLWEDMRNHYDVTEDGQRFLFTVPIDNARTTPYTVVAPWQPPVR